MRNFINSFMSNDSAFGRTMTKIGIIICANLMFVLFSMPVVTIGASYVALYHVMLKTLRGNTGLNPFKEFWIGFKSNFKQATIAWVIFALLFAFGYYNAGICRQATGFINYLQYGIYALGIVAVIIMIYLFPTMAAFANTIPNLIRNGLYFAFHKPWWLVVNLFFHVFPLYLTYSDPQMMPLYAFCWFFFGFGAITMLTSRLLIKDFSKYLPLVDDDGDFILTENGEKIMPGSPEEKAYFAGEGMNTGGRSMTEDEILEEMKKLDM